jgi:phospholipid/cholesterol/gamma-HCH transport system substrate-binding protein
MRSISTELKVGSFALAVLFVLSFMTFKVGGMQWFQQEGYIVYIYFNSVVGLDKNTKVKIAGIDAGNIEDIVLENGRAKVKVRINKGVPLYSDVSAVVKATGLLGDRYLEVKSGSKGSPLKEGDIISNTMEIADVDDLLRSVSKVAGDIGGISESLNEVFGSDESKRALRESIMALREITSNMNTAIIYNDKKLRKVLDNIDELSASLGEIVKTNREPLNTTLANVRDFTGSLKKDGPSLVENLRKTTDELRAMLQENRPSFKSTVDNLDKISSKVEKGEGTLGKLVNDDKLYESVNTAVTGLGKTMNAVDRFRTFITFQGDYLTKVKDTKGTFYLTLQPRPEKYYILGIVSDPIKRVSTSQSIVDGEDYIQQDIKKDIEFTAQYAQRFIKDDIFKNTALRLGLTENTFGVGADQFFLNDRLKMSVDAWDFGHEEYGARKAHVKVGMDYFIFKNLFISGGMDNLFNSESRGPYVGGGVRFEDEDIKYLMGSVPRIK